MNKNHNTPSCKNSGGVFKLESVLKGSYTHADLCEARNMLQYKMLSQYPYFNLFLVANVMVSRKKRNRSCCQVLSDKVYLPLVRKPSIAEARSYDSLGTTIFGEDFHLMTNIFQMGGEKPPTRIRYEDLHGLWWCNFLMDVLPG